MSEPRQLSITRVEACFRCGRLHSMKAKNNAGVTEASLSIFPHIHFTAAHPEWRLVYAGTYCLDHFTTPLDLSAMRASARERLPADKPVNWNFGFPDLPPAAQQEFTSYLKLWGLMPASADVQTSGGA